MGSSRRHVHRGLAGLALVGLVCLAVGAAVAVAGATGESTGGPVGQASADPDTVTLRVSLAADGTAAWRVAYRVELDDENATDAFESLRADVEGDPGPYVDRFASRMRATMRSAENATGRDMSIRNVTVATERESLPQGTYGVVVYRLEWEGFAAVEGDRIRAGDAIDRFFLDSRTALTIDWPADYRLAAVEPSATTVDERSVTWQGRREFGPGRPRVELARGTPGGAGGGATGGTALPLVGVVALAVLVVVAGTAWFYAHRDDGTAGLSGSSSGATEGDTPPAELLSNEERVLRLLEQRGGRIKQQQVAAELEWTDAKTSQVVGELRESDELEVFRLGRENVLTLPDVSIESGEGGDETV